MSKYYLVFYNEYEDNEFSVLVHVNNEAELDSKIKKILDEESGSTLLTYELVEDY